MTVATMTAYSGESLYQMKLSDKLTYSQLSAKIHSLTGDNISPKAIQKRISRWKLKKTEPVEYSSHGLDEEASMLKELLRSVSVLLTSPGSQQDIRQIDNTPILYKDMPVEERLEKLKEVIRLTNELVEDTDPVIREYSKVFETDRPIAICWVGCMHLGGRWTRHEIVEQKFKEVLSLKNAYMHQLGDEIEGFFPDWFSKASIIEQPLQVPLQIQLFDAYMEPLWSKNLGGVWSQHGTLWFEKRQGSTPLKERYLTRGIPFFDGSAYLTYKVGTQVYNLAVSHEFKGFSEWNPNHPMIKALTKKYPSADIVIAADKHNGAYQERQMFIEEFDAGLRPSPYVHLIQVGTSKVGLDKYSIRFFGRGVGDWYWTILYPDEHLVKVTRHFEDVVQAVS